MPLKLTRRHGSSYWYIRGSIRGIRVDERTGLGDQAAAKELLILRSAQNAPAAWLGSRGCSREAQVGHKEAA